jgi:colicin import membrane protein
MPLAANAPYAPRSTGRAGSVRSFALAFAIHGLLFAFLYFGIRWQSRPPAPIEAELWSEPPRPSAPAPKAAPKPAPEPPRPVAREQTKPEPAPAKPDIAVKEERKKPEPKREEKPKDDPIKAALDREQAQKEAKEQIARDLQRDTVAQKAASEAAQQSQKAAREWNDRVSAKVRSKIPFSIASTVPGNPEAQFEVALLPGLEVGSVRLTKTSGNPAYDDAAERAIKAASPLPPPASERVSPPRLLILKMRPKDE